MFLFQLLLTNVKPIRFFSIPSSSSSSLLQKILICFTFWYSDWSDGLLFSLHHFDSFVFQSRAIHAHPFQDIAQSRTQNPYTGQLFHMASIAAFFYYIASQTYVLCPDGERKKPSSLRFLLLLLIALYLFSIRFIIGMIVFFSVSALAIGWIFMDIYPNEHTRTKEKMKNVKRRSFEKTKTDRNKT